MYSPPVTIHRLVAEQFPEHYHSAFRHAEKRGLRLSIQRDDQLHPVISGNKWRKLAALSALHERGMAPSYIISCGGGHSNHLHALGYWCHDRNIPFVAIIRGDYQQSMTPTLDDLKRWNSQLIFVTKQQFSSLRAADFSPSALSMLAASLPIMAKVIHGKTLRTFDELWSVNSLAAMQAPSQYHAERATKEAWLIAEGGAGHAAYFGFQQAITDVLAHNQRADDDDQIQHLHLPVATGTSYIGYVLAIAQQCNLSHAKSSEPPSPPIGVIGELVLKGATQGIASHIQQQLAAHDISWISHQLSDQFHCGGYAKTPPELVQFVHTMNRHPLSKAQAFRIEPVYSGKLLFAVAERIRRNELPYEPRLVIHTGGLQGFRSV